MPRVTHVKSARKAQPNYDIKVGDSYYWWKFRYGGKICSKTYPKASRLTQSEYYGSIYDIQETIANMTELTESNKEEIISTIREIGEQCSEKHQNMPENLASSPTAELLENRSYAMEAWADELEQVEIPEEVDEPDMEPDFDMCENEDDIMEAEETYNQSVSDWEEYQDAVVTALEEFKQCEPEIE